MPYYLLDVHCHHGTAVLERLLFVALKDSSPNPIEVSLPIRVGKETKRSKPTKKG